MNTDPKSGVISLDELTLRGNLVFSGAAFGKELRDKAELDKKDSLEGSYTISIPENTVIFTLSFFLGMFGPSVEKLGSERFRAKYRFEGEAFDDFRETIAQGIAESLVSTPVHAT